MDTASRGEPDRWYQAQILKAEAVMTPALVMDNPGLYA